MLATTVNPMTMRAIRHHLASEDNWDWVSLTARTDQLRREVESGWRDLPAEKRASLARLAYGSPPERLTLLDRLVNEPLAKVITFLLRLSPSWRAQQDAFGQAAQALTMAILDAVERGDARLQGQFASAVGDAFGGVRVSRPVSREEFRARLAKTLPDRD